MAIYNLTKIQTVTYTYNATVEAENEKEAAELAARLDDDEWIMEDDDIENEIQVELDERATEEARAAADQD